MVTKRRFFNAVKKSKTPENVVLSGVLGGRGRRDRTLGTRFWRPLLYHLSYTPIRDRKLEVKREVRGSESFYPNAIIL